MNKNARLIAVKFNPAVLLEDIGEPHNWRERDGIIGRAKTAFFMASKDVRKNNLLKCVKGDSNTDNRVYFSFSDKKGYEGAVAGLRKVKGVEEVRLVMA